jgi:hypothetical protein
VAEKPRFQFTIVTAGAIALAIICVVIAIVYFSRTATALPSFFPGHVSAGDADATKHHTKHGIAFLGLAAVALGGAWMTTSPTTEANGPS